MARYTLHIEYAAENEQDAVDYAEEVVRLVTQVEDGGPFDLPVVVSTAEDWADQFYGWPDQGKWIDPALRKARGY